MDTILESWAQVDGGIRYHVRIGAREITIDADQSGRLSGFVRGPVSPEHERELLRSAFRCVREAVQDPSA